jgi:hypothetical protein
MGHQTLHDDAAITASVDRVHDELFTKVRDTRHRQGRGLRWSALGLAAVVLFGGGLATGAAYINAHAPASVVPAGLLKINCASGAPDDASTSNPSAPRQVVEYFNTATNSLVVTPPELVTANILNDPSVACGSEIPRVVAAIGQALPGLARQGDHCGTITIAGYPPAYFIADNTVRTTSSGQTQSGAFAINMVSAAAFAYAGPIATTNCSDLMLPAPSPTDPKMVTCKAASNTAMVYLDEKAVGAAGVCQQHGYRVWNR